MSFRPSDVVLTAIPFVGTFERTECEIAAAMLVAACAHHGDTWQPLTPPQMGTWLTAALDAKTEPWHSLNGNPFARPDFHDLVKRGFAEGNLTPGSPIALTQAAIARLSRWVRPTERMSPRQEKP